MHRLIAIFFLATCLVAGGGRAARGDAGALDFDPDARLLGFSQVTARVPQGTIQAPGRIPSGRSLHVHHNDRG